MWKWLGLTILVFANSAGAGPEDQRKLRLDLGCFLNKDEEACGRRLSSDGAADRDRSYLDVGCSEKNSPRLCAKRGVWLQKHGREKEAAASFAKACLGKDRDGCRQDLANVLNATQYGMAPDGLREAVARANAGYQVLCADSQAVSGKECVSVRQRIDTMSGLVTAKLCALDYWRMTADGEPAVHEAPPPTPSTAAACPEICAKAFKELKFDGEQDLKIRGRCAYDGKELGAELWRAHAQRKCPDTMVPGTTERPLFKRCYCESQPEEALLTWAKARGVFLYGIGVRPRMVMGGSWYACALKVNPILEAVTPFTGPGCPAALNRLKSELAQKVNGKRFELDVTDLRCR